MIMDVEARVSRRVAFRAGEITWSEWLALVIVMTDQPEAWEWVDELIDPEDGADWNSATAMGATFHEWSGPWR